MSGIENCSEEELGVFVSKINSMLAAGMKVEDVRKELGIARDKLRDVLRNNSYIYNQKSKQYTKKYKSSDGVVRDVAPGVNSECSDKTYFEKVDEMYNWYKEQMGKPQGLIVKKYNDTTVVKSYKVYSEIEKKFQEFCKENTQYKVQDILSKCIEEFLERYANQGV